MFLLVSDPLRSASTWRPLLIAQFYNNKPAYGRLVPCRIKAASTVIKTEHRVSVDRVGRTSTARKQPYIAGKVKQVRVTEVAAVGGGGVGAAVTTHDKSGDSQVEVVPMKLFLKSPGCGSFSTVPGRRSLLP